MTASHGKQRDTNHLSPTDVPTDGSSSSAEAEDAILDDILDNPSSMPRGKGITIGTFCGWNDEGAPLVEYPDNSRQIPVSARSTVALVKQDIGSEVALLFEDNSSRCPLVVGLIQPPVTDLTATVDDEVVVLEAKERIELRCGKAKIVLTRDGRILIKGTDVMSRSEGPNRLKGASIQIN